MSWVRSVPQVMPSGERRYTVVDCEGRAIEDVETFLHYLRALDFSAPQIM